MKNMHVRIVGLFGLLVMLVLFAGYQSVRGATPPVPEESQCKIVVNDTMLNFARAINAKDFSEFYQTIAKRWQAQITQEQLATAFQTFSVQNIDLTGLQQLDPVFTEPPAINSDGLLVLQGNYPTQNFTTDFTLKYLYEETAWKLFGISVNIQPFSDSSSEIGNLPTEKECDALLQGTMRDFAESVNTNDFSYFYTTIASLWRVQTSPEALKQAFQSFVEQDLDLTGLQDTTPILIRPSALNDDGWLVLQGHYPTQPSITYFKLAYLYEAPDWKLGSIDLKVTKDVPPNAYLQALVTNSMADFAAAVNAGDFSEFYDNIAELWREQTTVEELTSIFKMFSEQKIDLTVLQGMTPVFTGTSEINSEGWLVVEGNYPTQPSVVYFTLKYLFEVPHWKLVGINVDVK